MLCEWCGEARNTASGIVASGAWCAPTELVFAFPDVVLCDDCHARMVMVDNLGIDPGPKGEYLRVPRGGITYAG